MVKYTLNVPRDLLDAFLARSYFVEKVRGKGGNVIREFMRTYVDENGDVE